MGLLMRGGLGIGEKLRRNLEISFLVSFFLRGEGIGIWDLGELSNRREM